MSIHLLIYPSFSKIHPGQVDHRANTETQITTHIHIYTREFSQTKDGMKCKVGSTHHRWLQEKWNMTHTYTLGRQ